MRNRFLAAGLVAAAALMAAGCGSSSSGSGNAGSTPGGASGAALKTAAVSGATVLANAQGFTLYWFGPDTAGKSNCTGGCAQVWPPVTGPATAGTGVTGTLATITRSDGMVQATYDGHPLYTYTADTAPGQAKGNGVNASGGVWHEVTVSGGPVPASTPTSGGGGYGY